MLLSSKKPLFSNELVAKPLALSYRTLLGYVLTGLGFGLGGLMFDSFLLTVPSA